MEVGQLPYRSGVFEDYVGKNGLKKYGQKKWRQHVKIVVRTLIKALKPTDVVIGGGNVKRLKKLPPLCRPGDNANAFVGGFRLWQGGTVEEVRDRTTAQRDQIKKGAFIVL